MSARSNLVLRGTVFHFRRGVPNDLRALIQRRELVRSLAPSEARTAKLRACQLYLASEGLFSTLRMTPMPTDSQLARLVQDFYGLILDDEGQARQAMLRAGIDIAEVIGARYEGNVNLEPRDRLLRCRWKRLFQNHPFRRPLPLESPARSLKKLSRAEISYRSWESPSVPRRSLLARDRQTASQTSTTFRLFVNVCGDRPLAAYSREDVGRFRDKVERLPNDYGKHPRYRDLTVEEILAAFDALPTEGRAPVITQKTVKRHFSALSALWTTAVAKDEAAANIFSGFRFAGSRKASEQRDMWERAELARLFATPVWTGCASPTRRTTPGSLVVRDEKFWLPLIAVFSGLRQEEICQLHVEDIRQSEDVWFIDINDRPPRKVKNATAVRRVPIHSELIRFGFLAHVDKLRRIKQSRVFPRSRTWRG